MELPSALNPEGVVLVTVKYQRLQVLLTAEISVWSNQWSVYSFFNLELKFLNWKVIIILTTFWRLPHLIIFPHFLSPECHSRWVLFGFCYSFNIYHVSYGISLVSRFLLYCIVGLKVLHILAHIT